MKIQIRFKDPDAIYEITNGQHPLPSDADDITPRLGKAREDFDDKFFEYGDYGVIEIDTKTMACRLMPKKEWKP